MNTYPQYYLIAYDVSHVKCRRQVLSLIRPYSLSHQKSLFEIKLSPLQLGMLLPELQKHLHDQDTLLVIPGFKQPSWQLGKPPLIKQIGSLFIV